MSIFAGTGIALVTPFNENGSIDEASLRKLVDHVIAGGADYLVALGTTSEVATLTMEERNKVMEIILEQNSDRLPLMVGIGGNNTEEVVNQIRQYPYLDSCKAVLSVVPYYNKPSQEGLYQHFLRIGENSPLPVFLYNVPARTVTNMTASTVVRISQDCSNIIGVKEASGNLEQAADILKNKRAGFTVVSGDDATTLPLISIGGEGVISVVANVCPAEFSEMVRLAKAGHFKEAASIHLRLLDLYKALFAEGNPAGIKAALHIAGIIKCNKLRLPLTAVSTELYQKLQWILTGF